MKTNEIHMGDPFIYTHENTYYLTGTTDPDVGFRAFKSKDLTDWEPIGHILNKKDTGYGTGFFWAPEVFVHSGKFYLTYSACNEKTNKLQIALAVSDNPEGPFKNIAAPLFDCEKGTIDGHIFRDDDGGLYLYFSMNWFDDEEKTGRGENYVAKLRNDLTGLASEPVFVSRATMPWETVLPTNRCNEGPTVIKNGDDYYMTYSANDTCSDVYGIGYLKSKHPMHGWKKISETPWFTTGNGILSPGHNSIFKDLDGNLKIVYHKIESMANNARVVSISDLKIADGKLEIIL